MPNNQGFSKGYQPQPSASVDCGVTKTSRNKSLKATDNQVLPAFTV